MTKKKPRILVIGSINMDLLILTPRLPAAGETMLSDRYHFNPGGKGANQAVAAARLGAEVTFVGKVGGNAFGTQLMHGLRANGIQTDYVSTSTDHPSGFAVIVMEAGGDNRIIVHPGSNADLTPADIDRAFAHDYDAMIIQFEIPVDIAIHACQTARKRGIPFIVDAGPALDFPLEDITGAEILSPNETETHALTGIHPADEITAIKAARVLIKRSNAKHIVLKMGERGALHYTHNPSPTGTATFHPAFPVTPIDVTAAGDVFTAALTVQYVTHGNIDEAIRYANAAAALSVTKPGAQQAAPTTEEVENFIQNHKRA
ncbi:MAG: ribokinase [Defluviitaleaceae bacterium]|nr:ribokinase [Defluviitaleaceae bacterium]